MDKLKYTENFDKRFLILIYSVLLTLTLLSLIFVIPFSLSNFLRNISQPASSKISSPPTLGPLFLFQVFRLIINISHLSFLKIHLHSCQMSIWWSCLARWVVLYIMIFIWSTHCLYFTLQRKIKFMIKIWFYQNRNYACLQK